MIAGKAATAEQRRKRKWFWGRKLEGSVRVLTVNFHVPKRAVEPTCVEW